MLAKPHEDKLKQRPTENNVNAQTTKRISAGLLGRDFEEIESTLFGPGVWELRDRVARPHPIAPPQGSPLLYRKILSVKTTLKRFSPLFWR